MGVSGRKGKEGGRGEGEDARRAGQAGVLA